jgi:2-polyprenyl-3-methyl-5-hydroxy-6-metoxy-1,4-benzoquinol methylase
MQSLTENESATRLPVERKAAASSERKRDEYYFEPRLDVQALIEARGKRILDVGCAAGELGAALKRAGACEVVGVEASTEAAAQARGKLDRVIVGDAGSSDLPLDLAGFDYVIFADVLEHMVDPWAALASFSRYLKADGRVVASIPNARFYAVIARLIFNRWGYRESGILDRTHLRFFTWPTIKEMFAGAGLRIERVRPVYRLFEDQSQVGRTGALASRWFCRLIAPLVLWRHFFTFQYLVVARKSDD